MDINQKENCKALVFAPVYLWDVHHADTIELLYKLDKENKKTFLVNCVGDLSSCAANSNHSIEKCSRCIEISTYSNKNLYPKRTTLIQLKIPHYSLKLKKISPEKFFNLEFESLPVGRLVASQIADNLASYYFYYKWEKNMEAALYHAENCISLYKFFKEIIHSYNIDEVYAWNGRRPSDGPALYAAMNLNKKYFSFIVGSKPKTLFISEGCSVQDIKTANKNIRKIKKTFSHQMFCQAKQYLNSYLKGDCDQVGYKNYAGFKNFILDKRKKNLLLITSSPQESMHLNQFKNFFGLSPFEKIFSFVNQNKITDKFNVTVRWHPRKAKSHSYDIEIINNLEKSNPDIIHIYPNSNVKTENLIPQADVIVGTGSTLCLYAVTLGKPVILFGPLVSFFGNSVYSVNTPQELSFLLEGELRPKPSLDAYCLAYYRGSFGEPNQRVFFSEKKGYRKFYLTKSFFRKIPIHPK
jgi:hypothetical protein